MVDDFGIDDIALSLEHIEAAIGDLNVYDPDRNDNDMIAAALIGIGLILHGINDTLRNLIHQQK